MQCIGHSGPRVLFVDDEPHVLEGVRLALRKQPYHIETTTRASAVLEMQRDHSFDVIVADECMPEIRGSDLLTAIAREFPAVGRIVLTGHASVEAAVRAINMAGVTRFLLKPCAPQDLEEAIEAALRVRHASLDAAAGSDLRHAGRARQRSSKWGPAACGTSAGDIGLRPAAGEPETHEVVDARAAARLRGVLASHELIFHAQKIVSLERPVTVAGCAVVPHVALQEGRVVTLPEFLSTGQGHLLLPALDRWVVRQLVRTFHDGGYQTLLRSGLPLFLTVTAQSAADPDFMHFLGHELGGSALVEQVWIEIPEQVAVQSARSDTDALSGLRKSGCRLSVDGVGADLNRLIALRHLPVELLKIDGQLVRNALSHPHAQAAIRSIVDFARAEGIGTAAKGVDTIGAAEHLRKWGVELGQGAAFGPAEDFVGSFERLRWV